MGLFGGDSKSTVTTDTTTEDLVPTLNTNSAGSSAPTIVVNNSGKVSGGGDPLGYGWNWASDIFGGGFFAAPPETRAPLLDSGSAAGGASSSGGTGNTNINVVSTDAHTVDSAIAANLAGETATLGVVSHAGDVAAAANLAATTNVLTFANGVVSENNRVTADAIASAQKSEANTLAAANDAIVAVSNANEQNVGLTNTVLSNQQLLSNRLLDTVDHAFEGVGSAYSDSTQAIIKSNAQLQAATTTAIGQVAASTQSETAQQTTQIQKTLVMVVGIAAAALSIYAVAR